MMKAFPSITIPDAVRYETIERGKMDGYSDALALERLETKGWIKTVKLSSPEARRVAEELGKEIGKGEAEAIALALEKKERLLIDDKKGRQAASLYGIETTTTLGVMFELFINAVLTKEEYRKNVKNYGSQGWIAGDIIQEFLERGEEIE
jgi:predicted nucleic acid-binding protein